MRNASIVQNSHRGPLAILCDLTEIKCNDSGGWGPRPVCSLIVKQVSYENIHFCIL